MYQDELDLTTTTIQAVFGLYVLGLIPGLLLGGPVSDRYGRRRVMAPTLAASVVATGLLMLGGTGIGWLFAGRLVAGVASGAAFSSGAAWIKELSGATGGARRVTVAITAGFGLGPLVAGVLAQWARAPTVLPYAPHLVLAAVAFRPVLRASETRRPGRLTGLRQQFRIPEIRTHRFRAVVVPLAPWVFGSAAVALAYLPGLVRTHLGGHAVAFSALVTLLTAGAGILVQPLLVIGAAVVLGAGYGCCQVCGLLEVQRMARPDRLAGLTAAYQAISYLGFAAPFPLAWAARAVPAADLLVAVAALAALTLAWTAAQARSFRPGGVRYV